MNLLGQEDSYFLIWIQRALESTLFVKNLADLGTYRQDSQSSQKPTVEMKEKPALFYSLTPSNNPFGIQDNTVVSIIF